MGKGYVTTLLVEGGTLRKGDILLAGQYSGRVRNMFNERGQQVAEAGPSVPVSILGLDGAPNAGDRSVASRTNVRRAISPPAASSCSANRASVRTSTSPGRDRPPFGHRRLQGTQPDRERRRGRLRGSPHRFVAEAQHREHQGERDPPRRGSDRRERCAAGTASNAIIVGFQVRPTPGARKLAENEEIDIRLYSIIYDAIEEIKQAMEGMLAPKEVEKVTGTAEVRETFRISKVGTVAGCYVLDGKIARKNKVRLIREGIVVYTGELADLKRFKDDVKEVTHGYECGLNIKNFNDIKVGTPWRPSSWKR
jgi:translation initiation factor IF-2